MSKLHNDSNTGTELWLRNFWSVHVEMPWTRFSDPVYMWARLLVLTVIMTAGIFGNLLAIIVMTRPSLRRQPISGRFAALAVCDLFCCLVRGITWLGLISVLSGHSAPIQFHNDAWCGFTEYFFTAVHTSEAWMVSYITLERAIVIVSPIKGNEICRQSLGLPLTLFCLLGPFLLLGYFPITTKYVTGVHCATRAYPEMFVNFLIATTAISVVPLTLIFVCNVAIILALRQQDLRITMNNSRNVRFKRVTNMVLAVSLAFLATVFPQATNAMITVCHPHWKWLKVSDDLTGTLLDANYAINFYLYVITGKNVRREIASMFGCQTDKEKLRGENA